MTYLESLIAVRDAAVAKLLALESSMKFDHSIDGESIQYGINDLRKRIEDYNVMIAQAEGGFEVRSIGVT